ncbi:MAG: signal peptidase I, partial [Pirellulales bacterium]
MQPTAVSRGMRETIESIAIALALAFLFKTFEAEAFVIPTGSMAPTLMGRHKDVACPQCGYPYSASGSDEADHNGNERLDPGTQVVATTCPLCRFAMSVDPLAEENRGRDSSPSYSGDRIWVSKVPYHFSEPRRFDVIVFRYPLEAETYYIKRLVGLPGETVRIRHGDLFVKQQGESEFSIVRKPPDKLLAMAQIVHDSDYVGQELVDRKWPARWQPQPAEHTPGAWQVSDDTRSYHTDGRAGEQRQAQQQPARH